MGATTETVTIEMEKFVDCKPYLEYENGCLYEVMRVGDCGSKLCRVIDSHIVNSIRRDTLDEFMKLLSDRDYLVDNVCRDDCSKETFLSYMQDCADTLKNSYC